MRYAVEKRDLAESIAELREIADGRDHVLAEVESLPGIACGPRHLSMINDHSLLVLPWS
jgi:hypothetical protein